MMYKNVSFTHELIDSIQQNTSKDLWAHLLFIKHIVIKQKHISIAKTFIRSDLILYDRSFRISLSLHDDSTIYIVVFANEYHLFRHKVFLRKHKQWFCRKYH